MPNRKTPIATRTAAFTLVELLIVIGIIAVLISILLPAVGKVRIASQKVATQNTINRLVQGCEAYFSDFNAYPGPFAEYQLAGATPIGGQVQGSIPTLLIPGNPPAEQYPLQVPNPTSPGNYLPFARIPTSSENLFLGLCGGLRVVRGTPPAPANTFFYYDRELAKTGRGPASLNLNSYKKSQTYLEISNGDIVTAEDQRNPIVTNPLTDNAFWCPPAAQGGQAYSNGFVGDSPIFEFMDRFSRAKPILYLRAFRGVNRQTSGAGDVTGFIYDPAAPAGQTNPYQYDPTKAQYTYCNPGYNTTWDKIPTDFYPWLAKAMDYPAVMNDTNTKKKIKEGNQRYFANESLSTGDAVELGDVNAKLIPVHKDGFILISAGADGLYGTADDIRNP